MKKKIVIEAKGASQKQWSVIVLELNLMKKSWKKFGVTLDLRAEEIERIISFGTKTHDEIREESNEGISHSNSAK